MSKTEKLLLSLSTEEKEMLKLDSEASFLTMAQYIRLLIHKAHKKE